MTPRQRAKLERGILRDREREQHLDARREVYGTAQYKLGKDVVLAIGDLHCPYQHPDAADFIDAICQKYQPTVNVCMGDEIDQHALSRHIHDPDLMGAAGEHDAAVDELQWFFEMFKQMYVCASNHPTRYLKTAHGTGIPSVFLHDLKTALGAPAGWKWVDTKTIDGVRYEHGELVGGVHSINNYPIQVGYSVVFGHQHSKGGTVMIRRPTDILFSMATGCLVDPAALAMAYGKNFKHKPVLGSGVVEYGIPKWIPLMTDHRGRWIRKLV